MNKKKAKLLRARVGAVEKQMEYLARVNSSRAGELSELKETVRRQGIIIHGVLTPFIEDLTQGVNDGVVTYSVDSDYDDFSDFGAMRMQRVVTRREWHAEYKSSTRTVRDGELIERYYSKT